MTPVEFRESTSVVISWQRPLNFDKSKEFSYQIIYCRINLKDTCKTTEKTTGHDQVLKDLNQNDIYQWEIKIFDAEGIEGKSIKDTYKTKTRSESDSFFLLHCRRFFLHNPKKKKESEIIKEYRNSGYTPIKIK